MLAANVTPRMQQSRVVMAAVLVGPVCLLLYMMSSMRTSHTEQGINWWLMHGSLPGALRQGGFIPGDDDIDYGLWEAHCCKKRIFTFFRLAADLWCSVKVDYKNAMVNNTELTEALNAKGYDLHM